MSFISYGNFGRVELYYHVSGKDKLQHENIDKVNNSLRNLSKQLEGTNRRINILERNFKDVRKEINFD